MMNFLGFFGYIAAKISKVQTIDMEIEIRFQSRHEIGAIVGADK